ncbi:hypothetical protein LWI28_013727 [Acer negundo]|uniref:Ionotropic glutamate receptor C-terminal domain-containing protein n=1 Tax=Acer negundo TaxID=4023 RepID=A0AAD5J9B9_ACENE|nr:hypothetical protein LWI28_013727 [Acer negundo]
MTASLGSKLFTQANKVGMMNEGYAWIVTEGLSTLMDLIDPKVMDPSMQGERVVNNWSRFVLIIWVFVVLILTQSYTASLTSMLTVQRLKPRFADVKEIQDHDYFVGYQKDSFVKELLTKQLNFDESKLKPYSTEEEFHQALSNGTVAAIFDEIPYIK